MRTELTVFVASICCTIVVLSLGLSTYTYGKHYYETTKYHFFSNITTFTRMDNPLNISIDGVTLNTSLLDIDALSVETLEIDLWLSSGVLAFDFVNNRYDIVGSDLSDNVTITIPDTGTNSKFVMTESDQVINGAKTFQVLNADSYISNSTRTSTLNSYKIEFPSGTSLRHYDNGNHAVSFDPTASLGVNVTVVITRFGRRTTVFVPKITSTTGPDLTNITFRYLDVGREYLSPIKKVTYSTFGYTNGILMFIICTVDTYEISCVPLTQGGEFAGPGERGILSHCIRYISKSEGTDGCSDPTICDCNSGAPDYTCV